MPTYDSTVLFFRFVYLWINKFYGLFTFYRSTTYKYTNQ